MSKPYLLDLFCGAGGAAEGYHRAGFEVVGVDTVQQPRYPFEFVQADALTFDLDGFDVIHASPPCQGYSYAVTSDNSLRSNSRGKSEPRLIEAMRQRLAGRVYVIENVIGARSAMLNPLLLCGTMFQLPMARHRLFEVSVDIGVPEHLSCKGVARDYALAHGLNEREVIVAGKGGGTKQMQIWADIMGIDWMTRIEIVEAIPPAFTQHVGFELLKHI